MDSIRMPAGKYKGEYIEKLPSDYLGWVAANWEDDRIATAADEEYCRRVDEEYCRRVDEDDHIYEWQ